MANDLSVRVATADDAAVVAELNGIVQALHHGNRPDRFPAPDAAGVTRTFERWLGPDDEPPARPGAAATRGWICEDGAGRAVGYVLAVLTQRDATPFTSAARWVELDQIAVREDCRGAGAGRALAAAVEAWAAELDVPEVELTVWEFNETARAFFASLGFSTRQRRLSAPVRRAGEG
jgi:GNAT superfamily N-acetyltransferase